MIRQLHLGLEDIDNAEPERIGRLFNFWWLEKQEEKRQIREAENRVHARR